MNQQCGWGQGTIAISSPNRGQNSTNLQFVWIFQKFRYSRQKSPCRPTIDHPMIKA
jgi:hypothetical protein